MKQMFVGELFLFYIKKPLSLLSVGQLILRIYVTALHYIIY